jgi:hypothetical protein
MTTAQPFRPFRIKLAGGRVFTVKHPENVACDSRGREMVVFDDVGPHHVEMLLVDAIEPVRTPTDSDPDGNGPT